MSVGERRRGPASGAAGRERGGADPAGTAGAGERELLRARSPEMQSILRRVEAVARTGAPVLILGETGTGKEVLARALHSCSPRAAEPFVPVNCGALPGELLESELFGHVRGAFSGAVADRPGLFETASRGTLLLDEVADLSSTLQVKLLRVLQDGQVRRLGSNRSAFVDVRVVAATHKDVKALVEDGRFREDLYYRLKGFTVRLPPLRERTEDILPLARQFLAVERGAACRLSPATEAVLVSHRWPGNIRELHNAMRHAAVLAEGELVEPRHLPEELGSAAASLAPRSEALLTLAQVEREHVLTVLRACSGVQATAARILGIARNTLQRKLRTYGDVPDAAPSHLPGSVPGAASTQGAEAGGGGPEVRAPRS